jgi:hypothetical protein
MDRHVALDELGRAAVLAGPRDQLLSLIAMEIDKSQRCRFADAQSAIR